MLHSAGNVLRRKQRTFLQNVSSSSYLIAATHNNKKPPNFANDDVKEPTIL